MKISLRLFPGDAVPLRASVRQAFPWCSLSSFYVNTSFKTPLPGYQFFLVEYKVVVWWQALSWLMFDVTCSWLFFTRQIVLTVSTYAVVLLQFNAEDLASGILPLPGNCSCPCPDGSLHWWTHGHCFPSVAVLHLIVIYSCWWIMWKKKKKSLM